MKQRIYIFFIAGCMLYYSCNQNKIVLPSLVETYKKDDKKPFGGYVTYNAIKKMFDDRFVIINRDPFDTELVNSLSDRYSLFILLAKNLVMREDEANAMVDFVSAGNHLFIAADYIDTTLLNAINCYTERMEEIKSEVAGKMKQTCVKMPDPLGFNLPSYKYYYFPFLNSFSGFDSSKARVLGVNESGQPNFVILFIGKGELYLHAAPRSFSNYFLLTGDNYRYLEQVLYYLRSDPKKVYWDEYYKNKSINRRKIGSGNGSGNNSDSGSDDDKPFSSLDVIKQNPPLLWAFWLAIASIIIYILFNMKRKQRIINEIKPNVNTTVAFTETVGRLYLQKKNNKNVSEKMITYFYEHIRNNYFLNTGQVNNEFISRLSGKAGVDISVTRSLVDLISVVQAKQNVSDTELLLLNQLIQNFYKKKT